LPVTALSLGLYPEVDMSPVQLLRDHTQ